MNDDKKLLAELMRVEKSLHRPAPGMTLQSYIDMLEPEFMEVGASGIRYTRADVLVAREKRLDHPITDSWEDGNYRYQTLADGVYLLTYDLRQGERDSRRASIWRRHDGEWKMVYHQGTKV